MNKKSWIILGVVIIVIIIIFVSIGWDHKTAQAPAIPNNPTSTTTSTIVQVDSSTASSSMTVNIQGVYKGPSFSFNYPTSWSIVSISPFSLDTFAGKFATGGVIPKGGALINIATTTVSGPVQDIINTEIMSATSTVAGTQTIDNVSCQKETFQANYGPGDTSKDISIYCLRGSELWKIYLSYGANDPAGNTHVSDFDGILNSLKFLP